MGDDSDSDKTSKSTNTMPEVTSSTLKAGQCKDSAPCVLLQLSRSPSRTQDLVSLPLTLPLPSSAVARGQRGPIYDVMTAECTQGQTVNTAHLGQVIGAKVETLKRQSRLVW